MNSGTNPNLKLFIHRNRNKILSRSYMANLSSNFNDPSNNLADQNQFSLEHLKAMQIIAKMKEAADKAGAGFVGGFVTATGQHFLMSNVDQDDAQYQAIKDQLETTAQAKKQPTENTVKLIESADGIQLIIEPKHDD
jgi:hypothetical protein